MKVTILTFHTPPNYGALMQTYALQEVFKRIGYNVEIMDYRHYKINYSFADKIYNRRFDHFRKYYLNIGKKTMYNYEDAKDDNFDSDLYVVGSDQVWNPFITGDSKYIYFFNFLPINKQMISYAASFGVTEWRFDNDETQNIKRLLARFSLVTVREESGVKLCNEQLGVSADCVLDPTLLLGDFDSLVSSNSLRENNHIVAFLFNHNPEVYNMLRGLKAQYKVPVKLLNWLRPVRGLSNIVYPGIKTWIKSIAEAQLIITDSFHGMCFSILYQRQFIVLIAHKDRVTRIENVLKLLGLKDRLFYSYSEVLEDSRWKQKINYQDVNSILKLERNRVMDLLINIPK
jgi:hypothetical protein